MEYTDDGHFVLIKGRRWRATDPDIPDDVGAELRRTLMSARRAVGAARKAHDEDAEQAARALVQVAKTALGERGTPWWEQSDDERRARWQAGLSPAQPASPAQAAGPAAGSPGMEDPRSPAPRPP